jgi:hypothetical protein
VRGDQVWVQLPAPEMLATLACPRAVEATCESVA